MCIFSFVPFKFIPQWTLYSTRCRFPFGSSFTVIYNSNRFMHTLLEYMPSICVWWAWWNSDFSWTTNRQWKTCPEATTLLLCLFKGSQLQAFPVRVCVPGFFLKKVSVFHWIGLLLNYDLSSFVLNTPLQLSYHSLEWIILAGYEKCLRFTQMFIALNQKCLVIWPLLTISFHSTSQ